MLLSDRGKCSESKPCVCMCVVLSSLQSLGDSFQSHEFSKIAGDTVV